MASQLISVFFILNCIFHLAQLLDPCTVCQCETTLTQQISINCRNRGLKAVPDWGTTSNYPYREVTLANNDITEIPSQAFAGLKVEKIDLSNNPITTVHTLAFENTTNVKELTLGSARMTNFPLASLAQLPGLRELRLEGFNVTNVPRRIPGSLQHLTKLTLANCNIETLDADAFEGATSTLEEISLRNNKLQKLPKSALDTGLDVLTTLDLSHNQISRLGGQALSSLLNLKHLDVSSNLLSEIAHDSFTGYVRDSLQVINLDNNSLTQEDLNYLRDVIYLQELSLASNQLTAFPTNFLRLFQDLAKVNLQHNQIRSLSSLPFQGSPSIVELDLSFNRISSIQDNTFASLHKLEILILDNQEVTGLSSTLNAQTFRGLEQSLKTLSLEQLGLVSSDVESVSPLRNLEVLRLQWNRINNIPDKTFQYFSSLVSLDLGTNQLWALTPYTFFGLKDSLTTIILSNNSLQHINPCLFHNFSLIEINVAMNPLHCDCQLKWLKKWVEEEYDPFLTALLTWRCASPISMADRYFKDTQQNEFTCSEPLESNCEDYFTTTPRPTTTSATTPTTTSTTTPTTTSTTTITTSTTTSPTTTTSTTTTLPPTTSATTSSTTLPSMLVQPKLSEYTDQTASVSWTPMAVGVQGYRVLARKSSADAAGSFESPLLAQNEYEVFGLEPSTKYWICVVVKYAGLVHDKVDNCINVTTKATEAASAGLSSGAIAGIVAAAVIVIGAIIVGVIVLLCCRRRKEPQKTYVPPSLTLPQNRSNLPHIGYSSKRFRKTSGLQKPSLPDVSIIDRHNMSMLSDTHSVVPSERYVMRHPTAPSMPLPPTPDDVKKRQDDYLAPKDLKNSNSSGKRDSAYGSAIYCEIDLPPTEPHVYEGPMDLLESPVRKNPPILVPQTVIEVPEPQGDIKKGSFGRPKVYDETSVVV